MDRRQLYNGVSRITGLIMVIGSTIMLVGVAVAWRSVVQDVGVGKAWFALGSIVSAMIVGVLGLCGYLGWLFEALDWYGKDKGKG